MSRKAHKMKNILIATDLTQNCDRAMERAIKISKVANAKLHIIHVAPLYLLPKNKKEAEAAKEENERLIRSHIASYAGLKTVKTAVHIIESNNAFAEIIDSSQKFKADLIVMGVHNKKGFKDLFVGTTIERVIRKGITPVLMVTEKPKGEYKNAVVGCDFSSSSEKALKTAMQIASKSKVSLIHAYHFSNTRTGLKIDLYAGDVIMNLQSDMLEKFVKGNQKTLKKYGFIGKRFSHKLVKAEPLIALNNEVKKQKADLLAIGVNTKTGFITSKIGGVAEDILATPPCDVLVTKGS